MRQDASLLTNLKREVRISDAQLRHHQLLDELGTGCEGRADGEQEHGRLDRQRRQRRRQRRQRFQAGVFHFGQFSNFTFF